MWLSSPHFEHISRFGNHAFTVRRLRLDTWWCFRAEIQPYSFKNPTLFLQFTTKYSPRKPCLYGSEAQPRYLTSSERKIHRYSFKIQPYSFKIQPYFFISQQSTRLGSLAFTVRWRTAPIPDKLRAKNPSLFLQNSTLFFHFTTKYSPRKSCLYGSEAQPRYLTMLPSGNPTLLLLKSNLITSIPKKVLASEPCLYGSVAYSPDTWQAPSEKSILISSKIQPYSFNSQQSTRLGSLAFTVRWRTAPIPDKLRAKNPSLFLQESILILSLYNKVLASEALPLRFGGL